MTRKHMLTLGIAMLLLVAFVGTAAAQAAETPTPTPTPTDTPVEPTSKFFTHPVVQILSAYFGRAAIQPTVEPTTVPTLDPNDPNATLTPVPTEVPVDPQEQLAQEIAAYHEDGLGFGVLVKFYAMAEAAQTTCAPAGDATTPTDPAVEPACTAVTVDELVNSFRSGTGMGALFKEYGKPALLGVGQVRKMLNSQELYTTPEPSPVVTFGQQNNGHGSNGQGNGHKK